MAKRFRDAVRRSRVKRVKRSMRKAKRRTRLPRVKRMAVMGTGLPQKVIVKHRYVDTIPLTSLSGALTLMAYRANGMYDPQYAVGGHQPMYFDQYSALYNHYTVIGSKIKYTVAPAATSYPPFTVAAYLDDDATTVPANVNAIAEQTQGSRILVFPTGGTAARRLGLRFSAKRVFGGSILGNTDLQGSPSSDPVEASYYMFALQAAPASNAGVTVTVTIEYVAIWSELKDQAQS